MSTVPRHHGHEDGRHCSRVDGQQLVDDVRRQKRKVGGREQPGVGRRRRSLGLDVAQSLQHGGLHVGRIDGGAHDRRAIAGCGLLDDEVVSSSYDKDMIDGTAPPSVENAVDDGRPQPGQQQLRTLHATGLPGGGDDGITARCVHGRPPELDRCEQSR